MTDEPHANFQRVERNGHTFEVGSQPQYQYFWSAFQSGSWEQETFALFDHFLTKDTVYLDVGAWIGPTLLYAASLAKITIGFEPDPVAFQALSQNVAANPQFREIHLHQCAVAARSGQLRLGSRSALGDSASSTLFANEKESLSVEARRLEEFESEWPAGAPVFLKIDIEGGEYSLIPALCNFIRRHRPTLYLSLHADIFMKPYAGPSVGRKALGEARLLLLWLRFWPVFREYPFITSLTGQPLSRTMLFRRHTWRRTYAIVLSHQPPPGGRI